MKLRVLGAVLLGLAAAGWSEEPAFKTADSSYQLKFPRDHGAHPDFQTEWWYFTGLLYESSGQPFVAAPAFGFQLTFFRRASQPGDRSAWSQNYLAHAALADFKAGRFQHAQLSNPGGLEVAGAAQQTLKVWNGEWSAVAGAERLNLDFRLEHPQRPVRLQLSADFGAPLLVNGGAGLSRKGSCDRCASIYYSVPRLKLDGQLSVAEQRTAVRGLGWMDHEFMSNALSSDQIGWDWFSLMRQDGLSAMLFQIRSSNPTSAIKSGTALWQDQRRSLGPEDFAIEPRSSWTSPRSKAHYPGSWRIQVPSLALDELLRPLLADQELYFAAGAAADAVPTYWEGAISTQDHSVIGYAELTGYASPLKSDF